MRIPVDSRRCQYSIVCGRLSSVPVTSATLWKWWVQTRERRPGNQHVAAVVFRIPNPLWPIKINFHVWNDPLEAIAREQRGEAQIDSVLKSYGLNPFFVMEGAARSYQKEVTSEKALGQLFNKLLNDSWRSEDGRAQNIEVIIQGSITPDHIERIVTFYRTNKEFKKSKDKAY